MNKCLDIAKKLINEKSLSVDEYEYLIENRTKQIEGKRRSLWKRYLYKRID